MFKHMMVIFGLLLISQSVLGQEREKLTGTWKLLAFDVEFQATGERRPIYGKSPSGYLIFTPAGRVMVVIAGEGRKPAQTDQDRAELLRTMFAYTGTYRIEGDKLTTKVDVSWNEAWTGTDQVRTYKLEGDRIQFISAWAPSANIPEKPIVRGVITFERVN